MLELINFLNRQRIQLGSEQDGWTWFWSGKNERNPGAAQAMDYFIGSERLEIPEQALSRAGFKTRALRISVNFPPQFDWPGHPTHLVRTTTRYCPASACNIST